MPDPAILAALFGKPPADAIRHLESKGMRITFNWQEMLDHAHARAFTVAKAMRMDILQDIRRGLTDALENGQTLRDFEQALRPILQAKGWWGKVVVVDPDTQEAQLVQLGSSRRLKTIYQTNLQSAYMAGRYKRQMEADAFPYLMYVAVMDAKTRKSHALLNGKVYRKDDPVWDVIYPPNGFNCRCRTRSLTAGQVEREGRTVEPSPEIEKQDVRAGIDKVTGEVTHTTRHGVRVKDPATGRDKVMWVDVGFNASPAASHLMDDLLYKKARAAVGDQEAMRLVGEALTAPPRLAAWRAFVTNTLATGLAQRQTMTLGLAPALAIADGQAPVIYVSDRLLVGPKARRHDARGNAIDLKAWLALPEALARATWYRDRQTGHLIALLEDGTLLAIAPDGQVESVYRDGAAAEKIRAGRFVPLGMAG